MARSIVIIWAAALALTAEAALTSTPRTLRPRAALLGAAATSDDCGNSLKSCADCYSVLTCANLNGVYRPLTTTACSTSLPYCLNGECVATIDSTESCYKKPSTEFTCVGDGYYPSPSNCKKYYLCVDSEAYEYDCTSYSNTVYSQEMAMCVPRTFAYPSEAFQKSPTMDASFLNLDASMDLSMDSPIAMSTPMPSSSRTTMSSTTSGSARSVRRILDFSEEAMPPPSPPLAPAPLAPAPLGPAPATSASAPLAPATTTIFERLGPRPPPL